MQYCNAPRILRKTDKQMQACMRMSDNNQISTTYNFCIKAKLVANICFALKDIYQSHVHAIANRFVYKGYQIAIMYKIFATSRSFYWKRHVCSMIHSRHLIPFIGNVTCAL